MLVGEKVFILGAHPDDVEYGCLGSLLKMPDEVRKVIYVASMGSQGDATSGLNRCDESERALSCLKGSELHFRRHIGLSVHDFESVMGEIHSIIQDFQPNLILTMSQHDTHQEHRLLYELTISAARRSRASILSYGILSNTPEFRPTCFVDVDSVYQRKVAALREHKSQAEKCYMTDEYLRIFHGHNYAAIHGVSFCEAFETVQLFL